MAKNQRGRTKGEKNGNDVIKGMQEQYECYGGIN